MRFCLRRRETLSFNLQRRWLDAQILHLENEPLGLVFLLFSFNCVLLHARIHSEARTTRGQV